MNSSFELYQNPYYDQGQDQPLDTYNHFEQQHPPETYNTSTQHYEQEQHFSPPVFNNHSRANSERYTGVFAEYYSIKCHGGKGAIELKPSITRNNFETVMFEGAKSIGDKRFDWKNKISLQITRTELPELISTLLAISHSFEAKLHGPAKNKGMRLEWQKGANSINLFANIFESGKSLIAVPINRYEAMMLGHVSLVQYVNNFPGLTTDTCIQSLRILAQRNM